MSSLILQTATRFIVPVLIILSVVLFFRGHNHPGGGFIAGLMASIAFILHCFAFDVERATKAMRIAPRLWMVAGLLLALTAGLIGGMSDKPFLTGRWFTLHLPLLGEQHVGTPMLFDLGIYFVVIGAVGTIVANLAEERF